MYFYAPYPICDPDTPFIRQNWLHTTIATYVFLVVIYNHFSPFLSYPYFMNMWCSDDETDESLVSQQLYWILNISVIVKSTNSCIGHLWKNQLWRLKSAGKTHVFERLHTHKEAMLSAHHTGCLTREKLLQYRGYMIRDCNNRLIFKCALSLFPTFSPSVCKKPLTGSFSRKPLQRESNCQLCNIMVRVLVVVVHLAAF